jgi:uncharacterized protein
MNTGPRLPRHLRHTLLRLRDQFPVLAITGPRQSGKTTLARDLFSDLPYISLEDPAERAFAQEDPRGFLLRFARGAVFDEAQRWPDLFSYLQGLVDQGSYLGRFVLTGSQQFDLLSGISQSLAGRVAMTQLAPLAWSELPAERAASYEVNDWMLRGGYPVLHAGTLQAADWFSSYVMTYLERDVRHITRVQDLSIFQRFLRLCAGRTGQLLNLSALAVETGINQTTARAWLSVLEASYVVHLLPPYFVNFGKRLVKTPKLYFLDTGLAAWLMGVRGAEQLALHPMRGALFENLIVSEALKARFNAGQSPQLYFWRDNNGVEADLLFETPQGLQTIEIKSGHTVTADLVRAGQKSARFAGNAALTPWLVYAGEESYERSGVRLIAWRDFDLQQTSD